MSILSFIETKIGSLHNWPHDILTYIFFIRPSIFTTIEIASFFFGNKIPREAAIEFFQEYNHPSSQNIELLCKKYDTWHRQQRFKHKSWYYNMSIGRLEYINGYDHDQMEIVDEDPTGIKIGFGDSFPYNVRHRIEYRRSG